MPKPVGMIAVLLVVPRLLVAQSAAELRTVLDAARPAHLTAAEWTAVKRVYRTAGNAPRFPTGAAALRLKRQRSVNQTPHGALVRAWGGRMSKLDSAKEELGCLKVLFAVLLALDASLIAWASQAYDSASHYLLTMAFIGIGVLTAVAIWINRSAYRKIRELETL